jgi:peptide deformylase
MAIRSILIYPAPILQKKSKKITNIKSSEIKELIFDMIETMEKSDGMGLAAPQIGISLRLAVIAYDGKTHILINPSYKAKSWKKEIGDEGCLSFPGLFFPVKRHRKVTVKALDRNSNQIVIKAEGMLSRILQHEIDHLDGIPFTKRKAKNISIIIDKRNQIL